MWKSKTCSNIEWCGGWNNGVVGSWGTWFLDFDKCGVWNKHGGGGMFGQFLINVVAEITELWVENSQKINCRDVTSIREGRVNNNLFVDVGLYIIGKKIWKEIWLMTGSGIAITNSKIKYIMKAVKSLENRKISLKETTRKITSQEGGFLNSIEPLMTAGLPLMKNVLKPVTIIVLIPLVLTVAASSVDPSIKKIRSVQQH